VAREREGARHGEANDTGADNHAFDSPAIYST
jgi:hypothetical protein